MLVSLFLVLFFLMLIYSSLLKIIYSLVLHERMEDRICLCQSFISSENPLFNMYISMSCITQKVFTDKEMSVDVF